MTDQKVYHAIKVSLKDKVATVELARPGKGNALNDDMWQEIPQVVVRGQGKNFCAGIDLANISAMLAKGASTACPGRQREALRRHIRQLQNAFTAIEQCRWPVIAAIHGRASELALTGRTFKASEALQMGLVTQCLPDADAVHAAAHACAADMAAKSPLALVGTKHVLLHARDHSVTDGLEYVASWNAATLLSNDLREVVKASQERRKPIYSKL
eukprot:jgi/Astpho2/1690/Aster-04118